MAYVMALQQGWPTDGLQFKGSRSICGVAQPELITATPSQQRHPRLDRLGQRRLHERVHVGVVHDQAIRRRRRGPLRTIIILFIMAWRHPLTLGASLAPRLGPCPHRGRRGSSLRTQSGHLPMRSAPSSARSLDTSANLIPRRGVPARTSSSSRTSLATQRRISRLVPTTRMCSPVHNFSPLRTPQCSYRPGSKRSATRRTVPPFPAR